MFSATSLLLLACTCAVTINAQENDKCAYAQEGTSSNHPEHFQQLLIVAQIQQVTFPDPCKNGETGLTVLACDSDVAPLIHLDGNHLTITRRGALTGAVTVDATAYCG